MKTGLISYQKNCKVDAVVSCPAKMKTIEFAKISSLVNPFVASYCGYFAAYHMQHIGLKKWPLSGAISMACALSSGI